jgi:hypothetical protein
MAYSKEIPLKLLLSTFSDDHQAMILSYIPKKQTAFDALFGSMTEAEVRTMMEDYRPNDCSSWYDNPNRWFRQICVVGMNGYPAIQQMVIAAPHGHVHELIYLLHLMLRLMFIRCKLLGLSVDTAMSASNDVIWLNERAFAGIFQHVPDDWRWVEAISQWDSDYHKPIVRWHDHVFPKD